MYRLEPILSAARLLRRRAAMLAALLLGVALLVPHPAQAQDPRNFTFQNGSALWVTEVNLTLPNSQSWGPNVLTRAVQPGESVPIGFIGQRVGNSIPCVYDMAVITADGQEWDLWEVDLCSTAAVSFPSGPAGVAHQRGAPAQQPAARAQAAPVQQAVAPVQAAPIQQAVAPVQVAPVQQAVVQPQVALQPRNFNIQNLSSVWIVDVNVSPASSQDWGPNILNRMAQPGETIQITFTPMSHWGSSQCLYDIRVIGDDGWTTQDFNLNLCTPQTFSYR